MKKGGLSSLYTMFRLGEGLGMGKGKEVNFPIDFYLFRKEAEGKRNGLKGKAFP